MRAALLFAIACTAALTVWTLGQLILGNTAHSTGLLATEAMLITQVILATFITPLLVCDAKSTSLPELLPLVTTPWPLFLLLIGISGYSTTAMALSQLWVAGLILLSYLGTLGIMRVVRQDQLKTIALTILQLAPATILWAGREVWIPWFTG